jgi:hypothetical protein
MVSTQIETICNLDRVRLAHSIPSSGIPTMATGIDKTTDLFQLTLGLVSAIQNSLELFGALELVSTTGFRRMQATAGAAESGAGAPSRRAQSFKYLKS